MAVTINTLREYKQRGEAFSALTSYDATFAQLVSEAGVDVILIGDSLGMVLQGNDSTLPVTMDQMVYHVSCVAKGNRGSLVMADMPFMSYGTTEAALENAAELMRAGAHMVKLEGTDWMRDTIQALSERGVPVCAHLGLTPQFVNKFGGYKVQGRDEKAADLMVEHACELEAAGADVILLECVPAALAARIAKAVKAPVIGIGAGADTDGQVLVVHDMLGMTPGRKPRFVKDFLVENGSVAKALAAYAKAVSERTFPAEEHTFKA
ncbi:3-methyl-2-oxobutanoate hydroxymethyltransferase [Marinobacter sp. M3C]|uniref:3-methyl-2-oxobutanoate hydroxymethyltransferase n=1 Tax=unclassified Marinobacter TaxID=83889 RepID=UPI0020105EF5|nr:MULTISPECIES: 3-methyl-2-oxobutanoate hydroxymethyltransferase [unclassified Marinobacter]MCL1486602.1 3-methyl-2-oxobutanoate hydroxymethyltransferase [Marinobacter sp.]UQG56708.1 3-methyl-2-oxobutanoate hydroxymethyltransferase [Marinobacter sp. M4C]UQG62090.1 3-methyl-2-oxobutanoate hydroxymethyltransferase [Marinobacter sp. M3C]UQG65512.1 3-methyl-2-oxobutanoate hydroxymethyltransferase [Marinobacter sp. M2C]UQG69792.1 3-methyl-2-oxobutanoate hydroxymethyltransferase [Marinobacter sp. M